MKRLFFLAAAITFTFFLSSASLAGYVIKLKNGRNIPTAKFWEEKGEIRFYWSNGTAGIPKEDILSIEKGRETAGEGIPSARESVPKMREAVAKPEAVSAKGEKASEPEGEKERIDVEYYKKQKVFYIEKYQQAYEKYLEAGSRRDEEARKKAWEEFNHFGGQVITLEEELKKKNKGVVPKWWKE